MMDGFTNVSTKECEIVSVRVVDNGKNKKKKAHVTKSVQAKEPAPLKTTIWKQKLYLLQMLNFSLNALDKRLKRIYIR